MTEATNDQIDKAELNMLRRLFAEIIGPLDYHIQWRARFNMPILDRLIDLEGSENYPPSKSPLWDAFSSFRDCLNDYPIPNEEDEGGEAPFFTEAVLYGLIGKDAARSILGRLDTLSIEIQKSVMRETGEKPQST